MRAVAFLKIRSFVVCGIIVLLAHCTKEPDAPTLSTGEEILEINGAPASDKEKVREALKPKPGTIGQGVTYKVRGKDGKIFTKVVGGLKATGAPNAGSTPGGTPLTAPGAGGPLGTPVGASGANPAPNTPATRAVTPSTPGTPTAGGNSSNTSSNSSDGSESDEYEGNITRPCPELHDESGPSRKS